MWNKSKEVLKITQAIRILNAAYQCICRVKYKGQYNVEKIHQAVTEDVFKIRRKKKQQ